jgi:hypothetical protein
VVREMLEDVGVKIMGMLQNWTTNQYPWQDSTFCAIAFLTRFCQIASGSTILDFVTIFFTELGRQPCVQPPNWKTRSLYLCPPVAGWPSYTPEHGFPFCRLQRLAGLRWRYSNPPPQGETELPTDEILHTFTYFIKSTNTIQFSIIMQSRRLKTVTSSCID